MWLELIEGCVTISVRKIGIMVEEVITLDEMKNVIGMTKVKMLLTDHVRNYNVTHSCC